MISLSKAEEFEKAEEYKTKLKALENYQFKSMVVSSKIKDLDIYAIISDNDYAYINFTQISKESILACISPVVVNS